jgi:hypothetical protein
MYFTQRALIEPDALLRYHRDKCKTRTRRKLTFLPTSQSRRRWKMRNVRHSTLGVERKLPLCRRRERASGVTTELPLAPGLHGTETTLEGARLQPCHKQQRRRRPPCCRRPEWSPQGVTTKLLSLKTTHNHNGRHTFTRKAFGWVSLPLTRLNAIACKQKTRPNHEILCPITVMF